LIPLLLLTVPVKVLLFFVVSIRAISRDSLAPLL